MHWAALKEKEYTVTPGTQKGVDTGVQELAQARTQTQSQS